ncbi:MAG: Asp-tRNA(Asn)/Glu-tRNA(Gln) amidotransferase subunit GatB [Blastocatellia bacterium]
MDVRKVAELAHLELTEEEAAIYQPQMQQIVRYVEQLNELDLNGVKPMIGGLTEEGERTAAFREDEICPSFTPEEALAEAPAAAEGHFKVPKVL